MAHMIMENDNMFSVRQVPWHGLGVILEEAPDSAAAIKQAGLDWEVRQTVVKTDSGLLIPDWYANVRADTNQVLGMVTGRYGIVQNSEAFDFTDSLVGSGDVRYETAGSLRNNRTVWMLAKLQGSDAERFNLNDDKTEMYICFTNTHDGTGSVRVLMTPVRVVCQNTLNLAIKGAQRAWSTTHVGDFKAKAKVAAETLLGTKKYMNELQHTADRLSAIKVSAKRYAEIMNEILPIKDSDSERVKANILSKQEGIAQALKAPDIAKFKGTGWALVNAVSDFLQHSEPQRKTETFKENRLDATLKGDKLLDTVTAMILKAA